LEVDLKRRRISLTMKRQQPGDAATTRPPSQKPAARSQPAPARPSAAPSTSMAAAFAKLSS
jgi:transcriptional accessory protein Tex/SPT6